MAARLGTPPTLVDMIARRLGADDVRELLQQLIGSLETGKGAPSPDDVKIDNWN